ncbi:putative uncharacterized protein DDB_G0294196 [Seriola lalandi dorsalis]|uniref:putative uncharacterized protein DDB_G0294196 n=1 Tax=Seriola lalandi dorsalis TaxID=1841481 RepID=UPI000C6FB161|nr:putative uncharacterized protein DDB_G0294196 [Seriola lalandi dorsalis]XP_023274996.1 putative uncharacterized protein DDB_G0294196 [Seriola lalandi dorsalis]XP_056224293.1 putative uncharacterized protein DDB_G0294196 [Seriola aureovittata]
MDTAPTPPPPPPPSSLPLPGNLAQKKHPKPQPQFAAIPFTGHSPTLESNPSPEALHDAQGEENPPLFQVQNGPLSTPSEEQEDNDSDTKEKHIPVQETNPAPQALHGTLMTEQQDEQATQMEPAEEDQQA